MVGFVGPFTNGIDRYLQIMALLHNLMAPGNQVTDAESRSVVLLPSGLVAGGHYFEGRARPGQVARELLSE